MESQKKSATLPAGMAPPSSGSHGKSQQKLSSHSFSGGFLGRLKRRFRLKSKGYELQPGNQTAVQGVRFQHCPENIPGQRLQGEAGSAARRPGPADVVRTHSDRQTERPPQFRGGHKKDERKTRSDMLYDPNSAVQRNCLDTEVNIPNDYVASDTNVIDLESDGGGMAGDVFDEMDPGYETLDEVRRKMQIQFNQPQKMNGSACLPETELVCQRPKGPQHRRSQSTGHPQMSHPSEFCGMLDSGLGSPLVSDNSASMRTSDIVTRESLSVVSDTDISAYASVNSVGYTQHENFLNPTNLPSMRMNSCPGKTYDMSPGRSQDLLCPGGSGTVYNSDTYLPDHEVSELYANPKILMRKKSQREENEAKLRLSGHVSNRTSSNDSDEGNTSFDTDGKRSSTGDNKIDQKDLEEEAVPPIPERKYSLYLNQQNKRQNSQDKHVNTISVDSSYSSSVNESHLNESTCAMAESSMFSDHRCLADSAITDSVSSRVLNQSADTFGQDSGFWLSEDDDLLRSCDTSIHGDRTDIDKYCHNPSKPSPVIRFEKDERVILTGDVRTIAQESAISVKDIENVGFELQQKGEIIDHLTEDFSKREVSDDLYQNPWDVISDSDGQRRDVTSAILRQSGDAGLGSYKIQREVIPHTVERDVQDRNSSQNDHQLLQKRNSSGSRTSYKEMTVCQSASLEKLASENPTANSMVLSGQISSVQSNISVRTVDSAENCWSQQSDSVREHRNSVREHRNSVREQRNSIGEQRNSVGEHRNSTGEQKISVRDQRNSVREQRNSIGEQRNSVGEYRNSIGEQMISAGEKRNSGGTDRYSHSVKTDLQNTVLDASNQNQSNVHIINNKPVCADNYTIDQSDARILNNHYSQIPSKGRECHEQSASSCIKSTPDLESNSADQSLCERDFESSLEGSTEPSIDSLGGSTDCLSEKSIDQHVVSYEDDADAVLESMDVQTDSFADEMTMSVAGSLSIQCNSNDQILEGIQGMNISQDFDPPSDVSETLKTDSAEHETESISDPSDDIVSSASTLSPSARLPDYYYQDTEPVHMSLSELGMSEEQWVETEPIHMSVNELKRSKSHYEGEREHQSHFHTPSPSLWQSPPQNYTTELRSSSSTRDHALLPATQQCSNVYETVDDDDQQDFDSAVNVRPHGHPVMQAAYINNRGARPRRPYSVDVSSFQNRRNDDDFMKRLDSRPPAVIPRTNPEEASQRDFMESMRQLKDCGWYWGPLSWDEAEIKLMNKPDGSFLVRDSSDDRYILSLSFNMQGRVHHTRIEHHKGKFSFWSQPDSHGKATIREFIEQCVKNSRNGQFLYFIRPSGPGSPPMPVHLLHPISRYKQMQSLQHMCRFQILQKVRRDHIDKLPVPTQIKDYLKDPQYYVEYLEED